MKKDQLKRRQAAWDEMRAVGFDGQNRKYVQNGSMKNVLFTRPGSNKKNGAKGLGKR